MGLSSGDIMVDELRPFSYLGKTLPNAGGEPPRPDDTRMPKNQVGRHNFFYTFLFALSKIKERRDHDESVNTVTIRAPCPSKANPHDKRCEDTQTSPSFSLVI